MSSDVLPEFPYGALVEQLPEGVAPPETWAEFGLTASPEPFCAIEPVGVEPKGVRWSFWPLAFEEYVGDQEPNRTASAEGALARNRVVLWKRVNRRDTPPGWRKASERPWRIDGFFELARNTEYVSHWNHNARRDLKLWRRDFLGTKYSVENISLPEFEAAYRKSIVAKKAGTIMLKTLKRRLALPEREAATALFGVRNLATGEVIAGTAALFSETAHASVRECPFMLPEARDVYAATGLIDHWYQEAMMRNTKTLWYASFWFPGEPASWKGFSEFKSHFGLSYIAYPPLLWRFERGILF